MIHSKYGNLKYMEKVFRVFLKNDCSCMNHIYIWAGFTWDRWDQHFLHEISHQNTVKVIKKLNIHSKNNVKITFTEFFWCECLIFCYLHSIFAVKVSFFYPVLDFFTSKVFFRDGYSNFIYLHGVLQWSFMR